MIVLDTNVISALMQAHSNHTVVQWLDAQPADSIWITTITVFETRFGLALLADGNRKAALTEGFEALLREDLQEHILAFDSAAAERAANLAVLRQKEGKPVDMRDTQIAGICEARQATLATRNTKHFSDLSCPVVNPWDAPN